MEGGEQKVIIIGRAAAYTERGRVYKDGEGSRRPDSKRQAITNPENYIFSIKEIRRKTIQ